MEKSSVLEYTKHRVYIHAPQSQVGMKCIIGKLNDATTKCINDHSLSHDFKEMHRYQLIKLSDLIDLAKVQGVNTDRTYKSDLAQAQDLSNKNYCSYKHPSEKDPMRIDEWMLFTIKHANISELLKYV